MPAAKKKVTKKKAPVAKPKLKVTAPAKTKAKAKSKPDAKQKPQPKAKDKADKKAEKVLSSADMKSIEGVVKDLLTNLMKKKSKPQAAAKNAHSKKTKTEAKKVTRKKSR